MNYSLNCKITKDFNHRNSILINSIRLDLRKIQMKMEFNLNRQEVNQDQYYFNQIVGRVIWNQ